MNKETKNETLQLYKSLKEHDLSKENRLERWRNLEPESAEFISIIIKAQQSNKILELGTSNGFSTLWFADALKNNTGKITSVEIDKNRTEIAREYLTKFKLLEYVELVTADAKEYLSSADSDFDTIFLDAERKYYVEYWSDLKRLLQKDGSLLVVDNVISHEKEVENFIKMIQNDPDFKLSIINIGAGLLFVTKQ